MSNKSISSCDSEEFPVMDVNSIKAALREVLVENEDKKELVSVFTVEVEDITKNLKQRIEKVEESNQVKEKDNTERD